MPLSLRELLAQDGISQEEMSRIEDVRLEVYHMRNLPRKVRDRLTSDMGFVADFLNEGSFEHRQNQRIVHPEALCRMMEAITGDTRFTELIGELLKKQEEKGGEVIMCEYIDMLEARGEARGIQKGEAIGIQKGEARGMQKGLQKGEARGKIKGENRLADLIQRLLKDGRYDDISSAASDSGKRQELYRLYGI